MNTVQIADLFGFIGAGLGIIMFIPQAFQVYKTKNTKSISLATYVIIDIASFFWIAYALMISSLPVLMVNIVLILLSTYIIVMKIKHG